MVCGDNYTAVITGEEKLMVCGNMERGKLGLGRAFQTGVSFVLREVSLPCKVKDVACGPFHMLAICKPGKNQKEEGLFAWGSNEKGQLGIGSNTKIQSTPRQVLQMSGMKFRKVVCGTDFSLAMVVGHS